MRIALFQPDQAGNVGAVLRLGACLSVPVDIVEPCGFPFSDRALKRAGMDYAEIANVTRHPDWDAYERALAEIPNECSGDTMNVPVMNVPVMNVPVTL